MSIRNTPARRNLSINRSSYLDDLAFDVAQRLGRRPFDEREEQSPAEFVLHLHLQVGLHEQLESLVVNVLWGADRKVSSGR